MYLRSFELVVDSFDPARRLGPDLERTYTVADDAEKYWPTSSAAGDDSDENEWVVAAAIEEQLDAVAMVVVVVVAVAVAVVVDC